MTLSTASLYTVAVIIQIYKEMGDYQSVPTKENYWDLNSDETTIISDVSQSGVGQDMWIVAYLNYPLVYGLEIFEMCYIGDRGVQ